MTDHLEVIREIGAGLVITTAPMPSIR